METNKTAVETKETGTTQKMKPETSRQHNNKIRVLERRQRNCDSSGLSYLFCRLLFNISLLQINSLP